MSTYRINGIKYNPANWAGLDPAERAACNRFAAARERELNTISVTAYTCEGGPFNGHLLELEGGTCSTTQTSTAPMTVGAWCGRYELQGNKTSADRLVWVGNDGGQAINTHHHTTDKKKAGADVTGNGFDQLRDLLADLAEDPAERATSSPLGPRARYTIGRTVYTIAATPEAADRLRARITKAKRWFADKLLQAAPAPVPAKARSPEADHLAAVAAVAARRATIAAAMAIGAAQASASEELRPETDTAADESAELVTCDGPELAETAAAQADTPAAGCDAIGATDTPTEADPVDCTQAPETLAQAGGYTQAPETLRGRAGAAYNESAGFDARVKLAAAYISAGRSTGRAFDTCFEMNDGDAVAVAIWRRAQKRPDSQLAQNIWRYLHPETVRTAAEKAPAGLPLADWAKQLRGDTPTPQMDAIGATDTPTEADPADYTQARETLAQAGGYTQAPETLRADYLRAANAGHTQQAGSKTGAWSAVMFRTADGRAGLAFKRPGQPVELVDCATGGERMRTLQAMAQAAEQAHQQQRAADTPINTAAADTPHPVATTQAHPVAQSVPPAPVAQSVQTAADCTTQRETLGGAGSLTIRIERMEGLAEECGQPATVGSFAEADRVLLGWSETAPEHGGYNKCGFLITWPDGNTYEGRFDLVHHRRERPSLRDHIAGQAEFWLGKGCPMHMGAEEYHGVVSNASPEKIEQWCEVLELLRVHAAYFPNTKPISCTDLRALVDHLKIEPAELVGLGVTTYRPNERDLQRGAITEAETVEGRWSGAPQLLAVVTYEDGTREHIEADGLKDHNNSRHTRRRLNLQRHGAPYLAQLAAAAAAQKAAASSAAERKAQAEQKARADLLEKFAHLERGGGCVVAARNMRTLLKAAYPGVKFSVKTQQYSGGNNITVHWTDGPTDEAVGAIVNQFKHGSFNGMDDGYEFSRDPFPELFGGCYYIHANRDESPELIARALAEHFPDEATRPSVQDWQNRRGLFDWRNVYTGREAEAYAAEFRRTLAGIDATPPAKASRKAQA